MLEDPQIQQMMKQVAAGIFPAEQLLNVSSEVASDEEGKDALRITLIITDEAAGKLTGKQLTDLLVELHDSLLHQGDDRFPHLYFATPTDTDVTDEEA